MDNKEVKKEKEIKEIRGIGTSEIEKLNDDCLIEIFGYLTTIADKIRIERVCKRWQYMSQRSWNNFKFLDFLTKTWALKENSSGELLIRSVDFDKIIRLSGRYLTSISTDLGKFAKVCHLLPKIRELQLIDLCLDQSKDCPDKYIYEPADYQRKKQETTSQCTYDSWQVIISWLISHGEKLTNFKIKIRHSHYKEEDFARFLVEMKQMKCFHLYNYCEYLDWSGSYLRKLPFETIQEIFLMSNYTMLPFDNSLLPLIIKECKNLQAVGVEGGDGYVDGILEILPSQASSLKNLKLQFEKIDNTSVLFSTMSTLIHLQKLDFSCCFNLTDAFLEVVGKTCKKLTYLDLYGCHQVRDRGISSICDLDKLTHLNIGGLPEIENPPLEKLENLIYLRSCFDKNIEEECICSLLKKAHQLRALDVHYCGFVTNKILNVAAEIVRRRNCNIGLDLCVTGTLLNIDDLVEKPSLLNFLEDPDFMPLNKYGIEDIFVEIKDQEVSTY